MHQSSQTFEIFICQRWGELCANFALKGREGHKLTCLLTFDGKIPSAFSLQFVPNSILIGCFISDVHFSSITKATNMQRSLDIFCKKKCLFVKNLSTSTFQFLHKSWFFFYWWGGKYHGCKCTPHSPGKIIFLHTLLRT